MMGPKYSLRFGLFLLLSVVLAGCWGGGETQSEEFTSPQSGARQEENVSPQSEAKTVLQPTEEILDPSPEGEDRVARSQQLASRASAFLQDGKYERGLLLAVEAARQAETSEAVMALQSALTHPRRTEKILYHPESVRQALWSQDNRRILTASQDVRIWDVESGTELLRIEGHVMGINQLHWSQNEDRILTAGEDGTARVWDATTGTELLRLQGHRTGLIEARWSPDETYILTIGCDRKRNNIHRCRKGAMQVWDASSGTELVRMKGKSFGFNQAIWSQDGNRILTAGSDGSARVWDAFKGKELLRLEAHPVGVQQVRWNQDQSRIMTVGCDEASHINLQWCRKSSVRIWDANQGTELLQIQGIAAGINQAIWNQDGSRILTVGCVEYNVEKGGCMWGTAQVWDASTGAELLQLPGHSADIIQATWNFDENRLLTVGGCILRVWDATTGEGLFQLQCDDSDSGFQQAHWGHFQEDWRQEGSRILGVSDNKVQIWHLSLQTELMEDESIETLMEAACRQAPRNFSWQESWTELSAARYQPTCENAPIPIDVFEHFVDQAISLARQREIEEGKSWFGAAKSLDPEGKILPGVIQSYLQDILDTRMGVVIDNQFDSTLETLKQLDPNFTVPPEIEIQALCQDITMLILRDEADRTKIETLKESNLDFYPYLAQAMAEGIDHLPFWRQSQNPQRFFRGIQSWGLDAQQLRPLLLKALADKAATRTNQEEAQALVEVLQKLDPGYEVPTDIENNLLVQEINLVIQRNGQGVERIIPRLAEARAADPDLNIPPGLVERVVGLTLQATVTNNQERQELFIELAHQLDPHQEVLPELVQTIEPTLERFIRQNQQDKAREVVQMLQLLVPDYEPSPSISEALAGN